VDIQPGIRGFNTLIKSRGALRKVNKFPLTEINAKSLGADLVDNSSAATFMIKPTKGKPRKPEFSSPNFNFTAGKFRNPIRKGKTLPSKNVFIEKNAFRIDTGGELKQITAEGLLALRRKKAKKKFSEIFAGL